MPGRTLQGSSVYQPVNGSHPALGSQWQWPETPSAREVQGDAVGRKIQHQIGQFGIIGLEAVRKRPQGERGGLRQETIRFGQLAGGVARQQPERRAQQGQGNRPLNPSGMSCTTWPRPSVSVRMRP